MRIAEFDIWRPGYGGATVNVYLAGTTTLASLFTDSAMTVPAANPQVLGTLTIQSIVYGKFLVPIYVATAYELEIVSGDHTGVIEIPLTTLVGADASKAQATPLGGGNLQDLDALLGRIIYVEDTAALGASASTNNATITTALGRAAAVGGGYVILPDNPVITFTQLVIPDGVVLCGAGRAGSPTILQSQVADNCITFGTGSGLKDLVVDGVNNVASGVGLYMNNQAGTILQNVLVKRFETGIKKLGGSAAAWRELYIDSCANGARLQGSTVELANDRWEGGTVTNTTTLGVEVSYEDKPAKNVSLRSIGFTDNTGTAVVVNGAQDVKLADCWFSGNTKNWDVHDDTLAGVTDNLVKGFTLSGGLVNGGTATFDGQCTHVMLDRVTLLGVAVALGSVPSNILWRDCIEDADVTITSSSLGIHVVRQISANGDAPTSTVISTNATALKAWELSLLPGQAVQLEAKVIGLQRNGEGYATYHIAQSARRPGSQLAYKTQTANFTVGTMVTGTTSQATGRILADTDAGATGTLVLKDIVGEFLDNEELTDTSGGIAIANGVLVPQNAALLGSITSLCTAIESDATWGAIFAVNAGNVEVDVTGAASKTVVWTTSVVASVG